MIDKWSLRWWFFWFDFWTHLVFLSQRRGATIRYLSDIFMYDELWCAFQVYRFDGFAWFCLQPRFAKQGVLEFSRSRRGGDKKNGRLDCVWIVWWDVPTCLPMCSTTRCMEFAIPGHNMSRRVTTIKSKASRRARREPGPVICHEGTGRNTAKRVGGHTISMVETQHTDWNAPSNKL